jgi:hypothetical protein
VHQPVETPAPIVRVTDETTKAELEEAIVGHRETLRRMPAHWADRRARLHGLIDALLVDWEQAPDGRPEVPDA